MKKHPYSLEVGSFLKRLNDNGIVPTSIDDGGERYDISGAKLTKEAILSVDECSLYVTLPDGTKGVIIIVLGNEKGALPCDYSPSTLLDKVTNEHYEKWSD